MNTTKFDRQEIVDLLKECVCTVKFEKSDGSIRDMACTLSKEHVPEAIKLLGMPKKAPRAKNLDVICCWDMEIFEWRSFRVDSVISVTV